VMALVTGAVALALLRDKPPDRPVPGSFYLEARFQIESPVGISRNLYAKYWWRDGTHWRQEIEDRTPSPGAGTRIVVWNQDRQWEWDSRLNQTTEFNVEGSNPDAQLFSLPNWLPYLALTPVRLEAPSIDEYISRVNSSARGVTVNARRVGVDGALVGIELRQTGSEAAAPKTIWVEPDRLFIVRAQSSLPAVSASNVSAFYEVTRLEHEPRLTDDLFEFTPPSGSLRQQGQNVAAMYFPRSDDAGAPTPYQDVSGGLPLRMAPPFLSMGSLPERFVAWGEHSMPGADGAVAAVVTTFGDSKIQDPNQPYKGPYLLVEQQRRVDGLPGALRVGEGVDINGSPGFVVSEAGECSVAWLSGGVAVRLSSDVLTADELVELARGMYVRAN
ncbi:MAG TPA: hypothetical protein VFY90_05475, partial [Tepidiformaceae bacterium]|nr:hypothetical protein [Tepidiformaceae bacterium]